MGKLSGLIGALIFIGVVGLIVWFCCLRNKKHPRVQRFLSSFRSGPTTNNSRPEEISSVRNDQPQAITHGHFNPNPYSVQHSQNQQQAYAPPQQPYAPQQQYVAHQAYPMPMPMPYNENFQQNSNLPYPTVPGCDELPPPYHAIIKH